MNRKQKIIVSVTGIFLVLLVLVGLTYAFFLTRIKGNENPTSISVTTANLELVYQDNDSSIIGEGMFIEPDTVIGEKTFTVTNNGNVTIDNYGVIIENLAVKYVETQTIDEVTYTAGEITSLVNGEDGSPDMKLVITCSSSKSGKTCNGMNGFLPEKSGILLTNSIEEDEIHTYTATLTYLDDGTNQSADMNKTIEGRFNIIDMNNTVDIEGTVTNYTKGDFVQINSEEKESVIYPDGTYKFVGVKPDDHKITVRYKENDEEKLRSEQMPQTLSIVKGDNAEVSGNIITITDLSRTVIVNVDATASVPIIDNSIKDYNPFNEGTLAYSIFKNSVSNKNGTTFVNNPLTKPVKEKSQVTNYKTTGEVSTFINNMPVGVFASSTWYYYDTYEVNEKNGKFTLSGKHSCKYNSNTTNDSGESVSCYADMVGKYLSSNSNTGNGYSYNSNETRTNLNKIYEVTATTSSSLDYVTIYNSPNEAERVIVPTADDYGTSYYYRGDVEDNYVNFAGLCWRIVRIEGDESIKLILEDRMYECNHELFTGNWSDGNTYAFGNKNEETIDFINNTEGLSNSFKTFQNILSIKISEKYTGESISDKLKIDEWCYDNEVTETDSDGYEYYGAYTRIYTNKKPSLICSGTKLTKFKDDTDMYVGTITADEMSFAGATTSFDNFNYYLMNNYSKIESKGLYFWSLSPYGFNNAYALRLDNNGLLEVGHVVATNGGYSRPAVTLKTGTVITSGTGTIDDPYVIK